MDVNEWSLGAAGTTLTLAGVLVARIPRVRRWLDRDDAPGRRAALDAERGDRGWWRRLGWALAATAVLLVGSCGTALLVRLGPWLLPAAPRVPGWVWWAVTVPLAVVHGWCWWRVMAGAWPRADWRERFMLPTVAVAVAASGAPARWPDELLPFSTALAPAFVVMVGAYVIGRRREYARARAEVRAEMDQLAAAWEAEWRAERSRRLAAPLWGPEGFGPPQRFGGFVEEPSDGPEGRV